MTRLFTNVISFSSVWRNKTGRVGNGSQKSFVRNGFGYAWIHQKVGSRIPKEFRTTNQ